MIVDTFKCCKLCGKSLPTSCFSPDSHRKDGFVSNCRQCRNEQLRSRYANEPDGFLARSAKWRESHRNKAKQKESRRARYEARKSELLRLSAEWRKANPEKRRAYNAWRRSARLSATPIWLTDSDKRKIGEFFSLARRMEHEIGVPMHVDHIVPLNGVGVCGLHVPWNLQVLSAAENISKGNRYV